VQGATFGDLRKASAQAIVGCFGHASKNWSFSAHIALDLSLLEALIAFSICERLRGNSS
jgi:hypothetical protein